MKIGIAVVAFQRPKYLHVCLDSVFKVKDIDLYPVNVFVDAPTGVEYGDLKTPWWIENRKAMIDTISNFNVSKIVFAQTKLGILGNHMKAIRETFFDSDVDCVLMVPEDTIIRTDALEYITNTVSKVNSFFYNIMHVWYEQAEKPPIDDKWEQPEDGRFQIGFDPAGIVITKYAFESMERWINNREYLGLDFHGENVMLGAWTTATNSNCTIETATWDAIFYALAHQYKLVSYLPDKPYLACFGVIPNYSTERNEQRRYMEEKFFAGEKEQWLKNITDILRDGDYPDLIAEKLFPRYFDYR